MKVRHCTTIEQKWRPCDIGWGSVGDDGVKSCWDEPIEENCRLIVNTEDVAICPTCGTAIGIIADFMNEGR